MSLLSKILLLLLSLIILIITCVYTHVAEIRENYPINKLQDIIFESNDIQSTKEINSNNLLVKNIDNETNENIISPTIEDEPKSTDTPLVEEKVENNEIIKNDKPIKLESLVTLEADKSETKKNIQKEKASIKIEKKAVEVKVEEQKVESKKDLKVLFEEQKIKEKNKTQKTEDVIDVKVKKINYNLSDKNILIQKQINAELKKQRIIFKIASFELTKRSFIAIKKIALILNKNKDINIEVAGHTDAKGKKEVNQYFSYNRAKAVRKELIKYGVLKSRIKAKGYGESQPLVKNDPQGYSKINRRVEFNIVEER